MVGGRALDLDETRTWATVAGREIKIGEVLMIADKKKNPYIWTYSDPPGGYETAHKYQGWDTLIDDENDVWKDQGCLAGPKWIDRNTKEGILTLTVSLTWVFAIKLSGLCKARLVARGDKLTPQTYEETWAPTMDTEVLRLILDTAVSNNYILHQMDVKAAYLYADIDKEIYAFPPEGDPILKDPRYKLGLIAVYPVKKAIYGLKQAGHLWWSTFAEFMRKLGLKTSPEVRSTYVLQRDDMKLVFGVFVDDIIIAASNEKALDWARGALKERFKCKDLGRPEEILGLSIKYFDDGSIKLYKPHYAKKLIQKFEVNTAKDFGPTPLLSDFDYLSSRINLKTLRSSTKRY